MKKLVTLALELQIFFEEQRWEFCFIGGMATQIWGEPRFTQDFDVTLLTGFGDEGRFIDPLIHRYDSRLPAMRDFALKNRVLLLESDRITFDIALGGLPFEQSAVQRSTKHEYADGVWLRTCTAEDLIVFKAFAARDIDWHDVRGIIIRQGMKLDWPYIRTWLAPLLELKESPESMLKLEQMRRELESETM